MQLIPRALFSHLIRFSSATALLVALLSGGYSAPASAQTPLGCDAPFAIVESFPEGSKWETCWGYGANRGVYYYNFYYTPPIVHRTKVIADWLISQIQVAYDNNEARFHEVSGTML